MDLTQGCAHRLQALLEEIWLFLGATLEIGITLGECANQGVPPGEHFGEQDRSRVPVPIRATIATLIQVAVLVPTPATAWEWWQRRAMLIHSVDVDKFDACGADDDHIITRDVGMGQVMGFQAPEGIRHRQSQILSLLHGIGNAQLRVIHKPGPGWPLDPRHQDRPLQRGLGVEQIGTGSPGQTEAPRGSQPWQMLKLLKPGGMLSNPRITIPRMANFQGPERSIRVAAELINGCPFTHNVLDLIGENRMRYKLIEMRLDEQGRSQNRVKIRKNLHQVIILCARARRVSSQCNSRTVISSLSGSANCSHMRCCNW